MKYLSNSEMAEWRTCRRAWWLGYGRGLRRRGYRDYNAATGIGNRVHECLDQYYGHGVDPLATLALLRDRALSDDPAFSSDIQKEYDMCEAMLSGYVEWLAETGADQALRVTGSESALVVPFGEGLSLVSKLDVRIEHEEFGSNLSMDHKTVQALDTPIQTLQLDTQMLTQHLCEYIAQRDNGGIERARGVLYNMLKKSKRTARAAGPFFKREPVRHNEQQLLSHWKHVARIAQEIADATAHLNAGVDHHDIVPPSPTRDCKWRCPFFNVCPMFDDGSNVEAALAANYEIGDPIERYRGLIDLPAYEPAVKEKAEG